VAVAANVEHADQRREGDTHIRVEGADLAGFRRWFYGCLRRRADALFELTDAVLCTARAGGLAAGAVAFGGAPQGPWAMYDALTAGRIEIGSLRRGRAGLALPRGSNGQIRMAVDVSPWPRPDAECSPDRAHCHRPCRDEEPSMVCLTAILRRGLQPTTVAEGPFGVEPRPILRHPTISPQRRGLGIRRPRRRRLRMP
jgi:hypothetical protein